MAENPEDINFPLSSVSRIIKDSLPEGVNVSKEAKGAIGRAASVFILYATACANNHTIKGKRKTITPNDILQAVEDMEFNEFTPELKDCLEAFKKTQRDKKEAAADRKRKQATTEQAVTQEHVTIATSNHDNSGEQENMEIGGGQCSNETSLNNNNSLIINNSNDL